MIHEYTDQELAEVAEDVRHYQQGQLKVLNDLEKFLSATKGFSKRDMPSALAAWAMTYKIEVEKQLAKKG